MKRFLTDLLVTLLAALPLLGVADWAIGYEKSIFQNKYRYLEQHHADITTLVAGSSLAGNSFNPDVLGDSVYDLGMMGQVPYFDVLILQRQLPQMPHVSTVVYVLHYNMEKVDPSAFSSSNRLAWLVYNNYRGMHVKSNRNLNDLLFRSSFLSGYSRLHASLQGDPTDNGYDRLDHYYTSRGAGDKSDLLNPPTDIESVDTCIAIMSRMAEVCQCNGVRLIVVVPPFTDDWLSETTPFGRAAIDSVFGYLEQHYQVECRNYMYDSEFRNDSLYANWNHLNHRGATQLAERVKKDFGL